LTGQTQSSRFWILIPARGGSKGIPRKNVRPLGGKPLILHTLESCLQVAQPSRVVVSTDDEAIASIVGERCRLHKRPADLCGDEVTLDEVAAGVARWLLDEGATDSDALLTVQPTSPFLPPSAIEEALALLSEGAGSVLSVCDDTHLRWQTDEAGIARPLFQERVNRQWLPRSLAETGGLVGARLGDIVRTGTRIHEPVRLIELDGKAGIDIDTPADWALAEFYADRLEVSHRVAPVSHRVADVSPRHPPEHVSPSLMIGRQTVGSDHPPFVIAEAGVHHRNSVELAKQYIQQARSAGADAVKFQTYRAERLATRWAPTYWETAEPTTQFEVFAGRSRLSEEDYAALFSYAADVGIHLLSTPFDLESAAMLAGLGMVAFKIASGDLTYSPLLERIGGLGRPVLLSTGAATLDEVRRAVETVSSHGATEVALLHCSLAYPTSLADANLRRIDALRAAFPDMVVGYSDHTVPAESELACPLAVGRGASIVEKHFTLDPQQDGDDHYHSVDPAGLARLVKNCSDAWRATSGFKEMTAAEGPAREGARRSIVAAAGIPCGKVLEEADVDFKRPGTGLPPTSLDLVLGKRTVRALFADDLVTQDVLADDRLSVPHLIVGGVRVAPLSRADICSIIVDECRSRRTMPGSIRRTRLLFSANGQVLSLAARDAELREGLQKADLVHADGQALVFASRRIPGHSIPERSATTDLIHDLCRAALGEGPSFFLLGGDEDLNARCARTLGRLYPALNIAGRRNGYFDLSQELEVCEEINASGADIVWVGLGKPKEQLFCIRNQSALHAAWAITCGGCFSFVTGDYPRAPRWMQHAGLEWLFRATTRPKLLWRYATTNPHAALLLATKTAPGDFQTGASF
jgi:exopolysaccharide biosynthesis WecB/TagA/CpsF family protein